MRFNGKEITGLLFVLFIMTAAQAFCQEADSGYPYDAATRDPLAALVDSSGNILIAKKAGLGGLVLKGIIYSPAMPLAIINDEVLGEGDEVIGYTIVEITEKTVTLSKDNKESILKLEEE